MTINSPIPFPLKTYYLTIYNLVRQFDLGASTPVIEGVTGSETVSTPPDSYTSPKRFYILEMRPVISSNDFKMMFKVSDYYNRFDQV